MSSSKQTITIAICGAGGAGVISAGELLLSASCKAGYFGMLRKSFGPQIRGGESAVVVRLGAEPVRSFDAHVDVLVCLDWKYYTRFIDEIPISDGVGDDPPTLVIQDSLAGDPPDTIKASAIQTVPFSSMANTIDNGRASMTALGWLAAHLSVSSHVLEESLRNRFSHTSSDSLGGIIKSAQSGLNLVDTIRIALPQLSTVVDRDALWIASGNQMAALGALEAGVRFVAAYPITPASDALEWIASPLEQLGGHLVQAEDELAAVNMIIGAGFGGVPAMTATSGPGLALMVESMGLAVASETPIVILDVMRGGPSTGIPTKSEQGDLNLAIYGLHGDAPHIVLSPLSIADCYHTMALATNLATHYQTLAIVLSDQFMGQSMQAFSPVEKTQYMADFVQPQQAILGMPEVDSEGFMRYLDTASGISPMSVPGQPGCIYTADGLEHTQKGVPSPVADNHQKQLDKRKRKLSPIADHEEWAEVSGVGEIAVICFGSLFGAALEAQKRLAGENIKVKTIGVRLLAPFPKSQFLASIADCHTVLLIEQNHTGQFAQYVRSECPQVVLEGVAIPGPLLVTPDEIMKRVKLVIEGASPKAACEGEMA